MTRQERIDQLKAQAKAILEELDALISECAPDHAKELIADKFNELQDEITRLGGFDA